MTSDPAALLGQTPLFSSLPAAHLAQIAPHLVRQEHAPGVEIVRQGEAGDALYVLERGAVGVYVRDARLGLVQLVATIQPPEAFGEMALVTGEARTATCTALEPTVAWRLGADVFRAVIGQSPAVAMALARTLAQRLGALTAERAVPWVSLAGRRPDPKLWALLPEAMLRRARIVPLELRGRTLAVGMVDPADAASLDAVTRALPALRLEVVAVGAEDCQRFLDAAAGPQRAAAAGRASMASPEPRPAIAFLGDEARAGPASLSAAAGGAASLVVAALDDIVASALGAGASDIHVEPDRRGVVVRYRVDGVLRERSQVLPSDAARPLLSRIKLLARLDITETRRPQDGRVSVQTGNRIVDLRVSTMPSKLGEKAVLRILDAEASVTDLKSLFVVDKVRQVFSQMVFRPHGLVLVTGPTGSGKTTTMYSALHARRRPELSLVTVEDPIEYHLDGVTQIQVDPGAGTTFATVLRSLLRQDPDVIMVGELRDAETARMAVEASLTGHLVLASVHTNGALDAVVRLSDLGVERYAVANSLLGVLHQRLVRRCCARCAEPFEYPEPIVAMLHRAGAFQPTERPQLYRGKGCEACGGAGFKGRVALFELAVVNDAVRDAVASGADMPALRAAARAGAMIDLARYAGVLVASGATVPGEVLHMLQAVGGV